MTRPYLVRLETTFEGPDDLELAKMRIEADLHGVEFRGYDLGVIDVQMLPRQEQFPSTSMKVFEPTEQGVHDTYPPDAPPHPWDEGMWIFPDDHPLASIERQMHAQAVSVPPDKTEAIKDAALALPAPKEEA